jgi:hypothetical protein
MNVSKYYDLSQVLRFLLTGAKPDKSCFNKTSTIYSPYHYSFISIKNQELNKAGFKNQVSTATVYLVPIIGNGELWLEYTLVDDDNDELACSGTPWSLTYVYSVVGKNHVITGKEFTATFEELVDLLKDCGYKDFPGIDHLKKRSFKNYKQKYIRESDNVECNFCVSELGPYFYYQHASLKFDCSMEQDATKLIANDLMKMFGLCPGRSSVVECVRRYFPDDYNSMQQLDYDGDISGDCFPPVNYFTDEYHSMQEDESDEMECHDIRYISPNTEDMSVDRFLAKLSADNHSKIE